MVFLIAKYYRIFKKCQCHWLTVCLAWAVSGCATQPPPAPADPFAAIEAFDVKFIRQPPPDAKFIARIPCSSGSIDHWQEDCIVYLRAQAVKLGGNVVVPGVELDWNSHRIYVDEFNAEPPRSGFRPHPTNPLNPAQAAQLIPEKVHFWSNVYYSEKYD